ncbi:MAG: PIN domain-containing protein [Bacteroidales bacterium]|nr:PIN domain-containing protein [Bacteroidales bacterium]
MDTSVWIEYLRQNVDYFQDVQSMLARRMIVSVEPIFAELTYGVKNRKDKQMLNSYWQVLPRIDFGTDSMLEAAEYANNNDFQQLGIGLIDALIIQAAIQGDHLIWTLDKRINSNIDSKHIYK